MNFKIEQLDKATIFRPNEKRLDSMIAPELKAEFLILAQPDVQTLVLDLSAVEYVDSAGLSAMLLAQRQQAGHHGDMRIVGASDSVKSLLSLTALDRVFPLYDSIEEALAAPQLSAITIPPGDVTPATEALRTGMKMTASAIGVAAIADLMMADTMPDGFESALLDDDDDYDEDLDDDDLIDDEDAVIEVPIEEAEDEAAEDDLTEALDDDDIEEIEEDDMLEADDLDLDDDDDDDDDIF
ncbi:MAG: STAS domain-containing protein [bacterium]